MSERALLMKNYRNLGVGENGTKLIINYSANEKETGDLVILVGSNNSGKSNVLNAIRSVFTDEALKNGAKPDFLIDSNPETSLSFRILDDNKSFVYSISDKKGSNYAYSLGEPKQTIDYAKENENIKRISQLIEKLYGRMIGVSNLPALVESLKSIVDNNPLTATSSEIDVVAKYDQLQKTTLKYNTLISHRQATRDFNALSTTYAAELSQEEKKLFSSFLSTSYVAPRNAGELIKDEFKKIYKYDFIPTILKYDEQKLSNKHLSAPYNEWQNSPLLVSVFKMVGITNDSINTLYSQYRINNNVSTLTRYQKKCESKVREIASKFNQMYLSKSEKYDFELNFGESKISFGISLNETALNYERQSTGFQWFFNLYFNYLYNQQLKTGDIIIMDEPATNLHIKGQEELRDFLKAFAISNKITIVIATHSPFLTSPDYFDELRIVQRNGSSANVVNNFCDAYGPDSHDTLDPIISSFTTRSSVLVDPSKRVIFVEGITDYNYLVAFKKVLGFDDLVFVPINGLGEKGSYESTISQLMKIRKDPILLVDSDKAGVNFAKTVETNKTGPLVIHLKEVHENCKEIEDLFAEEDQKKYEISESNKHVGSSSIFKNQLVSGKIQISKETKDNFKKLLAHLSTNI